MEQSWNLGMVFILIVIVILILAFIIENEDLDDEESVPVWFAKHKVRS